MNLTLKFYATGIANSCKLTSTSVMLFVSAVANNLSPKLQMSGTAVDQGAMLHHHSR